MLSLWAMQWLASPQNGWKFENIANSKGLYSMTIDAAEAGATREELSEAIFDSFNDEFKLAVSFNYTGFAAKLTWSVTLWTMTLHQVD